jgi:hypothetical protein
MLIKTLQRLEQMRSMDSTLIGSQLRSFCDPLLDRGWIAAIGYLSHIDVEVWDDVGEEVEVEIDEAAGRYTYPHPHRPRVILGGPLNEMTRYRFQREAFFEHLAALLGIEPRFAARRRSLVDLHLGYLGDIRVGGGHAFAPVFLGRLLKWAPVEQITTALSDPALGTGGVVLALTDPKLAWPNGHQVRAVADLLLVEDGVERFDLAMLNRILAGLPTDPADEPGEWFDAKTGRLKLEHLEASVMFEGIQAKIIGVFWKDRDAAPLQWTADVMGRAGSVVPTLDKAMGGKERRERFIETVSRGKFRLRRS